MSDEIKENPKQQSTCLRGLYMLMFALFYGIAEFVLFAVVFFQFLFKLFTGKTNARLLKLEQAIATYIYQIIRFLIFNSEYQACSFGVRTKGEPSELKI